MKVFDEGQVEEELDDGGRHVDDEDERSAKNQDTPCRCATLTCGGDKEADGRRPEDEDGDQYGLSAVKRRLAQHAHPGRIERGASLEIDERAKPVGGIEQDTVVPCQRPGERVQREPVFGRVKNGHGAEDEGAQSEYEGKRPFEFAMLRSDNVSVKESDRQAGDAACREMLRAHCCDDRGHRNDFDGPGVFLVVPNGCETQYAGGRQPVPGTEERRVDPAEEQDADRRDVAVFREPFLIHGDHRKKDANAKNACAQLAW